MTGRSLTAPDDTRATKTKLPIHEKTQAPLSHFFMASQTLDMENTIFRRVRRPLQLRGGTPSCTQIFASISAAGSVSSCA